MVKQTSENQLSGEVRDDFGQNFLILVLDIQLFLEVLNSILLKNFLQIVVKNTFLEIFRKKYPVGYFHSETKLLEIII